MKRIINKYKNKTIFRYLFVGGTSYLIELTTLLLILYALNSSKELATAISYWVGLLIAFSLQKLIAFQDYRREVRTITKQGLAFAVLTLWNYVFTIMVVSLFPAQYILFSRTLAQAIFSTWNYLIYKHYLFKKDS